MNEHASSAAVVPAFDELAEVELNAARARAGWARLLFLLVACAFTAVAVFTVRESITAQVDWTAAPVGGEESANPR
jgi:hypothetical protein